MNPLAQIIIGYVSKYLGVIHVYNLIEKQWNSILQALEQN